MQALIDALKKSATEAYIAAALTQNRMESNRLMRLGELLEGEARGLRSMLPAQTELAA